MPFHFNLILLLRNRFNMICLYRPPVKTRCCLYEWCQTDQLFIGKKQKFKISSSALPPVISCYCIYQIIMKHISFSLPDVPLNLNSPFLNLYIFERVCQNTSV